MSCGGVALFLRWDPRTELALGEDTGCSRQSSRLSAAQRRRVRRRQLGQWALPMRLLPMTLNP